MEITKYIDLARGKTETRSDYALAKLLGITETTVNRYTRGEGVPDDYACLRLSEVTGEDFAKIVMAANYDREKNEQKKREWARHLRKRVALWMSAALLCAGAGPLVSDHGQPMAGEAQLTPYKLCGLWTSIRRLGKALERIHLEVTTCLGNNRFGSTRDRGFGRFPAFGS